MDADSLLVVLGPAACTHIEVEDELLIGRRAGGAGQLGGDSELSRRHAMISRSGTRLTIVDLGSTNGTRLNGRLLSGPTDLREGDRIELGSSALEVRTAATTPPAGADAQSGRPVEQVIPPFALPDVDRRDGRKARMSSQIALGGVAAVAVAAAAVLFATRGTDQAGFRPTTRRSGWRATARCIRPSPRSCCHRSGPRHGSQRCGSDHLPRWPARPVKG
jgi:hypothetical protein